MAARKAAQWPELVLLRHGIAEDRAAGLADHKRRLTPTGRHRSRLVLLHAAVQQLSGDRLASSPLVRARQTAEIAVQANVVRGLEIVEGLAPGGDPIPFLQSWYDQICRTSCGRLWLVGHEPDLGYLIGLLIGAPNTAIGLKKAGLALLRAPQHVGATTLVTAVPWQLCRLLTPASRALARSRGGPSCNPAR